MVCKDVPRLAARTTVQASLFDHLYVPLPDQAPQPRDEASQGQSDLDASRDQRLTESSAARTRSMRSLCQLVWDIAQYMESVEDFSRIQGQLLHLLSTDAQDAGDMQYVMQHILDDVISRSSKTAKILRLVNQGVVLEGMFIVRASCSKSGVLNYCRDLREARGWQVVIQLSPSVIKVSHRRQENCGNPLLGEQGSFECGWCIQSLLDANLTDLISVDVRFTNVKFTPKSPEQLRRSVNAALSNGELIVA